MSRRKHQKVWSCQEEEQLQNLEEADITMFTSSPVPVRSEDDGEEDRPRSPQLFVGKPEVMKTGARAEDSHRRDGHILLTMDQENRTVGKERIGAI